MSSTAKGKDSEMKLTAGASRRSISGERVFPVDPPRASASTDNNSRVNVKSTGDGKASDLLKVDPIRHVRSHTVLHTKHTRQPSSGSTNHNPSSKGHVEYDLDGRRIVASSQALSVSRHSPSSLFANSNAASTLSMAHAQSVNSFNRLASKDSRSVSQRLSKSATPSSHLSRHRARDSSSSHVLQIPKEGKLSSSHSSVHRSRGSFPLREIAHQTISHSKHSSIADNIQSHKSKSNLDLKVKTEYSGDLYLENSNDVEIPNVNSAAQRGSQITPNLLKENAFEQRSSVNTRSDSPQNVEILSPSPQMHFDTQESEAENIKQKMFEPDLASNTSTGPLDSYYSIRSNSPDTKLRGPIINLIPGSSEDLVGTSKPILYGGYASSFDSDQEIGNSNYASSFESDQEKGPSGNTENIIDQSISPLSAQNETPIIDPPNISSNAATFQSRIHASSTKIAEEPNKSLVMKRQDSDLLASVSQKRMIGAQSSYGLGVPANFDLKNAPAASLQDYPKQTSHSANSLHSKTATDQDQRRDSRSLYFSDQSKSKSIRESISVVRPLSGVPKVSANAPKKLIESHISAGKVSSHQNIATLLNSKQDNKVPEGDAMISISRHSITGSRNLLNIDKSTFRISRSPVSKNSEPSLNRKEPRNDATSPFISKKNQISSNNDIAAGKTTKRTNALGTGTSEYSLSGARIIKEKGFEDQANEFVIPKLNKLSASIDKKISDEIDMVESAIGVLTNGIDQLQAAINSKNIKIIKALEDGDAKLAELLASKTGVLESQISSLAVETNLQTTSHSRLQRDVQSISSSLQHKFSELLQKYEFCQSELERASQTLDSQIQTNRALESRIVEIERIQKADGRKMKELVVDIGTHGDQISSLDKAVKSRVTKTVLEELTRHIFTKEEISKCVDDITDAKIKKQYRNLCRLPAIITNFLKQVPKTVEESVKEKMRLAVQVFDEKMDAIRNEVDAPHTSTRVTQAYRIASANIEKVLRNEMKTWTQTYLSSAIRDASDLRLNFIENVKVEVNTYLEDQMNLFEKTQRNALERDPHIQEFVGHMTREFDEKLFRICEDVAGCKELFTKQLSQPFYRCGQWLWNTGQLKLGSSIPWSVEAANTDPGNFKFKKGDCYIQVAEAGLYEINLAFFTQHKPSIQLVVNGESVLSAINSPSYIVHHSSGMTMGGEGKLEWGTVTGISLVDFIALPAKSSISIHYHHSKKDQVGHGFIALKRM